MSRHTIIWALVVIIIVFVIGGIVLRYAANGDSSTPGQPSPHALDQSQ